MSIDFLKGLRRPTCIPWSNSALPLIENTIVWQSIIDFWQVAITSFTVETRLMSPVGPLEAFVNEEKNGTHRRAVLPDLVTPTGNPRVSSIVY